jgi:hypothetical protein
MFRELSLNSDEEDDDLQFIADIIQILPLLPIYSESLNSLINFPDNEFRMRYRFDKRTVLTIAEILDSQPKAMTNAVSTINRVLITLR